MKEEEPEVKAEIIIHPEAKRSENMIGNNIPIPEDPFCHFTTYGNHTYYARVDSYGNEYDSMSTEEFKRFLESEREK